MDAVTRRIAAELALELSALTDRLLDPLYAKENYDALRDFLWDNKIGILRVLQAHAAES